MKRRTEQIKLRAAVCSRFRIPWDQYPRLTVREHAVLVELLAEEAKELDRMAEQARSARPGRAGMTRVC